MRVPSSLVSFHSFLELLPVSRGVTTGLLVVVFDFGEILLLFGNHSHVLAKITSRTDTRAETNK
jgi:hypothetical protein